MDSARRWNKTPVAEVASMAQKNRLTLEVRQAILSHLRERLDAKAVAISSVKKTVYAAVPRCTMSDTELTNLIAETAIEAGYGVNFDGKQN